MIIPLIDDRKIPGPGWRTRPARGSEAAINEVPVGDGVVGLNSEEKLTAQKNLGYLAGHE